ncbi:Ribonuclease III [Mucinivorans hirudinis]|uniref:Ribonuclease 3 n=1 Tax=Mucinivorans hirudinis TaxID=1433126 RepID=A0A060R987_9BACT|nr:Ribonuclease III [Mucinivorans hirudinis]
MIGFLRRHIGKNSYYYSFIHSIFGVTPSNVELYKLALVHRSSSIVLEDRSVINNERLEFLGDAVIETIVSELLFIDYPEMNEGGLTQLRSRIVSRYTLNNLAIELGIDTQVVANPASINVHKNNLYGDAFEALVGALYLDKGYNFTNRTLIKLFSENLDIEGMTVTEHDFKSRIIEWCQKHRKSVEFKSVASSNSSFISTLIIEGVVEGHGEGRSKKEAEQSAASRFYETRICE